MENQTLEKQYVVKRQVAPTFYGVQLHYVHTTRPEPGELVYEGEFKGRTEVWGLNEPVRARVLDPIGEITSKEFVSEPAEASKS